MDSATKNNFEDLDGQVKISASKPKLTIEEEIIFYGPAGHHVILTGRITAIYEGGVVFRHNINTYPGCSGAAIYLLDKNQPDSVLEGDHCCVIGVHAGGMSEDKFNVGMAIYKDFFEMSRPDDQSLFA